MYNLVTNTILTLLINYLTTNINKSYSQNVQYLQFTDLDKT